ncbi:DAZ interacting zinc finger protein 1 [Leptinotarsa decemlineata]|uniref:DAZ interacting zinc finger protein 1 n=1 Tax=Leptinotarsa decemlineata TaxID=7539 RepID=UPI003D30C767
MWLEAENHKWHYDYVRLAWDAGFSFGKSKYTSLDKNKIYMVDIDRIIKDRDFSSVEKHISTVLQYVLEGEQVEILDTNFVNFFRMSQLSIEYLLFCKKYLDHTVTILKQDIVKLKQEMKQMRSYTEELETHISVLTKNNLVATFKCEKCSKAFSTEEYLNSHLKRRHNEEDKLNPNIEAEKLHLEIKELKERLNNTEKRIQKDSDEIESDKLRDDEFDASKLINEIHKNFEKFREHVENKIDTLYSEKNFYDDKYNKLFNIVLEYRNREDDQRKEQEVQNVKESSVEHSNMKESTTQTENAEKSEKLQIETIHNTNYYEFKEGSTEELTAEDDHVHNEILEKKMNAFGEILENKISTGLFSIENQMKVFYEKLSKLESNQNITVDKIEQSIPVSSLSAKITHSHDEKPIIKPRTKFSKPTTLPKTEETSREVEKIRTELGAILSRAKNNEQKLVQNAVGNMYDTLDSETESDSESTEKNPPETISNLKESVAMVGDKLEEKKMIDKRKRVEKSNVTVEKPKHVEKHPVDVKKTIPVDNKQMVEKLRQKMNDILYSRLQEMGISPNWKGIPKKTFQRALEIVEHQASLSKKFLPNYDSVKKSIEKSISLDFEKNTAGTVRLQKSLSSNKEKPNLVKIRYKKKIKEDETKSKPIVTIKNRSMYDTDSESEVIANHILSPAKEVEKNQAAVIKELKFLQSKSIPTITGDTDSDLNSILLSDDKHTVETKSAMKSYPSDGSLVKKKVLFDIEAGDNIDEEVSRKGGTATDLTRHIQSEQTKKNVESSYSDFEIN